MISRKKKFLYFITVWKFHDFSLTQILREINFGDSTSAISAILTHLQALDFEFYEFLHYLMAEIKKSTKFRAPKRAKTAISELLDSSKLISR